MVKRSAIIILIVGVLLLALTACGLLGGGSEEPAEPEAVATQPPATIPFELIPTATPPGGQPQEEPAAEATAQAPGTQPARGRIRVGFDPGTTSNYLFGRVRAGDQVSYILEGQPGQRLVTALAAGGEGLRLSLIGPEGEQIATVADSVLPAAGDYFLNVHGGPAEAAYAVFVSLGDALEPVDPVRVRFPPGSTSTTLTGNIVPGGQFTYVLAGKAGQRLVNTLNSETGEASIGLVGPGDVSYISVTDSILEADGDYFLTVFGGESNTNYTLKVTLSDQ